jgi:hypothetical protein
MFTRRALFLTILFVTNYHRIFSTSLNDFMANGKADRSVCNSAGILSQCKFNLGVVMVPTNETISCFLNLLDTDKIQKKCSTHLKANVNSTLEVCKSDHVDYCRNINSTGGPLRSLVCLLNNYFSCTENCQIQMRDVFGKTIPCLEESNKYCVNKSNTSAIMACLNDHLAGDEFSFECMKRISTDNDGTNLCLINA